MKEELGHNGYPFPKLVGIEERYRLEVKSGFINMHEMVQCFWRGVITKERINKKISTNAVLSRERFYLVLENLREVLVASGTSRSHWELPALIL